MSTGLYEKGDNTMKDNYMILDYIGIEIDDMNKRFYDFEEVTEEAIAKGLESFMIYFYTGDDMIAALEVNNFKEGMNCFKELLA
jgi:hypothetical protein